ncbi:hypothetical protein OS493_032838 [Desmophyllum pertusum]|uniref:Laminin G domain-containing protein n=1 Tax=Desmophyllum pertusum TaxID=174260 RepID=A0A9W9YVT4_9CNID|nr:hypothetical protein OS493_032838 [Desmophyllum pertusum]
MEGTGYITYDLRSNTIATKTNDITLSFKTFRPSGLMVHSSGSQGDFITIELIHGRVRFTINLGSSKTISGKHTVLLGSNLSDNKWHEVKVNRNERTVIVTVDKLRSQTTTPGSFVRLDLDTFIYVGGLDTRESADFDGAIKAPNFNGCMKNLYFYFADIFYNAMVDLFDYNTQGFVRFYCPETGYVPVNFPTPDTHLKLNRHSPNNFSVALSFRTYTSNGILVYKQSSNARLYLKLVSGKLELEIRVGTDKPIKISVGEALNDGMWHDVIAGVTRKELWVAVGCETGTTSRKPVVGRNRRFSKSCLYWLRNAE